MLITQYHINTYCVLAGGVTKRLYYVCCRDGDYHPCTKPRQTGKNVPTKRIQGKLTTHAYPENMLISMKMAMLQQHVQWDTLTINLDLMKICIYH